MSCVTWFLYHQTPRHVKGFPVIAPCGPSLPPSMYHTAFNRPRVADAKEEVGKAITLFILEAKSEASGQVCVLGACPSTGFPMPFLELSPPNRIPGKPLARPMEFQSCPHRETSAATPGPKLLQSSPRGSPRPSEPGPQFIMHDPPMRADVESGH